MVLDRVPAKAGLKRLRNQRVQIHSEESHKRPKHGRRQTFQNVAGNVPCHKIPVSCGDHYPVDKIRHPTRPTLRPRVSK